jgi:carboxypeptidase Taq
MPCSDGLLNLLGGAFMSTNTQSDLNLLRERLGEVDDLNHAVAVLSWDQLVMMPEGGAVARGHAMETIATIQHEKFTSDEIGKLLDKLEGHAASLPEDDDDRCLIERTRYHWERQRRIPSELAGELAGFEATHVPIWLEARKEKDFTIFAPSLQKAVDLQMRVIDCFDPTDTPYDVLLEENQIGMTTAEVKALFDNVRAGLKPLIEQVATNLDAVDDSPLNQRYPVETQVALCRELAQGIGTTEDAWRLDPTVHPFETRFACTDVRLTTKYVENDLAVAVGGVNHEFGHGIYERQVSPDLERTGLNYGASLGLHESQSRTWENQVGRSRSYWEWAYPIYAKHFPEQAKKYDANAIYRAMNKMYPSLIRTESDQLTYGMHIILRFEIEQEMINGTLAISDVRDSWNARMKDLLGVDVPDDTRGVLQDIHWAGGGIGYFSAYLIGNVISAQGWELVERDIPDITDHFRRGEFGALRAWQKKHLHRHGSKFSPRAMTEKFLGGPIHHEPYVRYLTGRVNEFYA